MDNSHRVLRKGWTARWFPRLFTDSRKWNRRSGRDRRAFPRVLTSLVCEEPRGGAHAFRLTYDLSPFGLSTRYGPPYRPGKRVHLRLHLPDDPARPLELVACVLGLHEVSGGMRLAFLNPSGLAVQRVNRFLTRLRAPASTGAVP